MVYDRLPGVDIPRHKQPQRSSNMAETSTTSQAEDNVLHSIASKTPKEHKIGEIRTVRLSAIFFDPQKKLQIRNRRAFFCERTVEFVEDECLAAK